MARVKLGPIVTDITGSIGGLTIQRNRYGIAMRAKPLPLKSQSTSQLRIRRLIIYLQQQWQALSDAQRLQWNRFLDFSGQTIRRDRSIKLSGQALFIKYQLFRLMADEDLLSPIAYSPVPELQLFKEIRIVETYFALYFYAEIDSSEYFFQFFCTNPRSPSKVFSHSGLRYMNIPWESAANYDFKQSYLDAFGVGFSIGDTIHYTIQYFSVLSPVFSAKYSGITTILGPL